MDPALLAALSGLLAAVASAGPWVVLALVILALVVGFLRKLIVPGWLYEDVEHRLDAALRQAETSALMTKELTDIVTTALVRRGDWVDTADVREYPAPQRRRPKRQLPVDPDRD